MKKFRKLRKVANWRFWRLKEDWLNQKIKEERSLKILVKAGKNLGKGWV